MESFLKRSYNTDTGESTGKTEREGGRNMQGSRGMSADQARSLLSGLSSEEKRLLYTLLLRIEQQRTQAA